MQKIRIALLPLILLMLLSVNQRLHAQEIRYNTGLYWTIELGQLNGFGRVNFQGNSFDYSASTLAISSSVGYSLNPNSSIGLGAWVSSYSPFSNDNLAFPFFVEYSYAFKVQDASPIVTARLGNSFKFGEASEVENGLFMNLRVGYRKLPVLKRFYLNPFVGLVFQQVKDDSAFVSTGSVQSPSILVTDNVTYKAVQLGVKFYIIK